MLRESVVFIGIASIPFLMIHHIAHAAAGSETV